MAIRLCPLTRDTRHLAPFSSPFPLSPLQIWLIIPPCAVGSVRGEKPGIRDAVGSGMRRDTSRRFLAKPPLWRMAVLLGIGLVLSLSAYIHKRSCRPPELPDDLSVIGVRKVYEMLEVVGKSDFGRSPRGALLTAAAMKLMDEGRVRFSPNLEQEALYRKEPGRRPVLYISVFFHNERVLWPRAEELAERLYHESLHSLVQAKHRSREEECDAFCAASEAAAAVDQRLPGYPVMRDGKPVWEWVQETYAEYPSDETYVPVGCTLKELAARTGITH